MTRRSLLRTSALAATASLFPPRVWAAARRRAALHLAARVIAAAAVPLPAGKREPFG